jgi:ABC-type branched-subunit amino acid transport system substrate-binding protein
MQNAVDLAVAQNASLADGYSLSAINVDEANGFTDQAVETVASNHLTMGIVGPQNSQDAVAMLPTIEANGIATISPTATLPGLTQANLASAEGISFTQIHPAGKPLAFFRLPPTDDIAGKVAANVAMAPQGSTGLGAHAVFIVDDGTASGKALAAAFKQELQANQGTVVGQQSLTLGASDNTQPTVSAIVEANPDIVYFAGSIGTGAELRSALTLSGAPQLTILASGPIADDPTWGTAVGLPAASTFTTGILPAQDFSKLANTKDFVVAFHTNFPGVSSPPESALAYDAAMDEINAIKSLIHAGKSVTRAAVLAAVASTQYTGITGTISFNQNGDSQTPLAFSLYTCDSKGTWHYQTSLKG